MILFCNAIFSVQSVCKVQGMISLKRGRLGNALAWALKSQDGNFTSYLAEAFLREYCSSGNLRSTDLLDNLGSCMLLSDRLVFLGELFGCFGKMIYKMPNNCFLVLILIYECLKCVKVIINLILMFCVLREVLRVP